MNAPARTRVIVYHTYYGCDTGCCGHTVEMGGKEQFEFSHPFSSDPREFAERLIAETFGAAHVADLDWENCHVTDNC